MLMPVFLSRAPNGYHNSALPASPTSALPGTPEKVAVLEERAQQGQALFHPDDAELSWSRRHRGISVRRLLTA